MKHRIQAPDGTVHIIEAPEGATPQQIEEFAATVIPQGPAGAKSPQQPPMSRMEAGLTSFMEGIPLGREVVAGSGALFANVMGGIPIKEGYNAIRADLNQDRDAAREQYPNTALAANFAGGVASGLAVPSKMLQGGSIMHRAIKGSGVAAGFGFGYGLQEGDSVQERLGSGIESAVTAAPFGAVSSVAADGIARAGSMAGRKVIGPLTAKAQDYINRRAKPVPPGGNNSVASGGAAGDNTLAAMQKALVRPDIDTSPIPGTSIPLSKAELTQDPKLQALQYGAEAGVYGDDAQKLALVARDIKSDAAKNALSKTAGADVSEISTYAEADKINKILKAAYDGARKRTSAAYKKVGEMEGQNPLVFAAEYIRGGVVPQIKDLAENGLDGIAFDVARMPKAGPLFKEMMSIDRNKKISSVTFQGMEKWRGRMSTALADAKAALLPGVKGNSETTFLSAAIQRYDEAVAALPREAIKNGDDAVLDAISNARSLRAQQGRLFERQKLVADILDNDLITDEELANMLFSFKADAGPRLESIAKAAGEKSADVMLSAKRGIYSRILRNSLDAREIKGGGGGVEEMVSFDKLATNLKRFINDNPTLFKLIHPAKEEQDFIKNVLYDAQRIKSHKPGTKNYSNTGYTLLSFLRQISPSVERTNIFGVGPGSMAKAIGEGQALADLERNLAPVIRQSADDLAGPVYKFSEKYGRQAAIGGAAAYENSRKRRKNELYITVRPSDAKTE